MKILKEDQELVIIPNEGIDEISSDVADNHSQETEKSHEGFCSCIELTEVLRAAIQSEKSAIEQYNQILKRNDITPNQAEQLQELLNDEQDHIIILTDMLENQYREEYPGRGEE